MVPVTVPLAAAREAVVVPLVVVREVKEEPLPATADHSAKYSVLPVAIPSAQVRAVKPVVMAYMTVLESEIRLALTTSTL
jgi:hypothetical protein